MKKVASLLLLSSLILSMPVLAGNRPGALTLSFSGGAMYFSSQRELHNAGIGSLELGYDITPHWAVEGLLGGVSTTFKPAVHNNQRVHVTVFTLDGLYRFCPYYFIEPYVMAGIGATGFDHNLNASNNSGNVNVGVGSQFFFDPNMAFRVDARDLYTITSTRNDVIVEAGISFLFDINRW